MNLRVLAMVLALAAPLAAEVPEVRVSIAALPHTGEASPVFKPREGELCRLQVTVQNRAKTPVVLHKITLRAGGSVDHHGDATHRSFHAGHQYCEEIQEEGDSLRLGVKYSSRSGAVKPGPKMPPYAMAGGANTTRLNSVTPDGVVMPAESAIRTFPWMPAAPDGALALDAEATASLLAWSPQLARAFWFLSPDTKFPARPAWMDAEVTPHPEPETEVFWVSYSRPRQWPAQPDLRGALMDRGAAGGLAEARGSNRILVEPGQPAVKSLLVQTSRKPTRVIRSASAGAWFFCSEGHTWIVTPARRLELNQDVGDFLLRRVLAGQDGAPFDVDLETAKSMAPHLAGFPTGTGTRWQRACARVPPAALIDKLAEADRLGMKPTEDGFTGR